MKRMLVRRQSVRDNLDKEITLNDNETYNQIIRTENNKAKETAESKTTCKTPPKSKMIIKSKTPFKPHKSKPTKMINAEDSMLPVVYVKRLSSGDISRWIPSRRTAYSSSQKQNKRSPEPARESSISPKDQEENFTLLYEESSDDNEPTTETRKRRSHSPIPNPKSGVCIDTTNNRETIRKFDNVFVHINTMTETMMEITSKIRHELQGILDSMVAEK